MKDAKLSHYEQEVKKLIGTKSKQEVVELYLHKMIMQGCDCLDPDPLFRGHDQNLLRRYLDAVERAKIDFIDKHAAKMSDEAFVASFGSLMAKGEVHPYVIEGMGVTEPKK